MHIPGSTVDHQIANSSEKRQQSCSCNCALLLPLLTFIHILDVILLRLTVSISSCVCMAGKRHPKPQLVITAQMKVVSRGPSTLAADIQRGEQHSVGSLLPLGDT